MIMKVWILIREEDYYDHLWYIVKVFSSQEKAEEHKKQLEDKEIEDYEKQPYIIEEHEII